MKIEIIKIWYYNIYYKKIKIKKTEQIWSWLQDDFLSSIYGSTWYNQEPTNLKNYIKDYSSVIVGCVLLRQARVKSSACRSSIQTIDCFSDYEVTTMENNNFGLAWLPQDTASSISSPETPSSLNLQNAFQYTKASKLNSQPFIGKYSNYLGGGYVYQLNTSLANPAQTLTDLADLQANDWIDRATRAVFIEFTLYNANVDLFAYCTILFGIIPTGNIVFTKEFYPISLYSNETAVIIALDLIFIAITLLLVFKEIKLIRKFKCSYLKNSWSYVNWTLFIFSMVSFAMYLNRLYEMYNLRKQIQAKSGEVINFQSITSWNTLLIMCLSFCCFLASIKLIKIVSISRTITLLGKVFKECFQELVGFMLVYLILLVSFVNLMYLISYDRNIQFKSFFSSFLTCFLILLGKFNMESFMADTGFLGTLAYIAFATLMIILLLNLFISILYSQFSTLRREQIELNKDEESIIFILIKNRVFPLVKSLLRIKESEKPEVAAAKNNLQYSDHITMFEVRTTQLAHQLYNMRDK